jgi:hypothetical protein
VNRKRQKRASLLVAVIAIGIAILLLSIAHADVAGHTDFLLLLPVVFIGVLHCLSVLSPAEYQRLGLKMSGPAVPAGFQRPPPFLTK